MSILAWVLKNRTERLGLSSKCSGLLTIPPYFKLRVGIFRSYEWCERNICCEILKGCIAVSEYGAVSRRLVDEAIPYEVL